MSKNVTTPKGTVLPLTNLKGKDYLMVAYRVQWFNETESHFTIDTTFPLVTDDQTIATAKVTVFDANGKVLRSATATKRETVEGFPDHTEKAETSAIGRALALLGFGTQFALADLDEGDQRLADTPLSATTPVPATPTGPTPPPPAASKAPKPKAKVPKATHLLIEKAFTVLESKRLVTKEEFKKTYLNDASPRDNTEEQNQAIWNRILGAYPEMAAACI